jgi:hypothetical protein
MASLETIRNIKKDGTLQNSPHIVMLTGFDAVHVWHLPVHKQQMVR